jgi:extradiol dioxygenase family protein
MPHLPRFHLAFPVRDLDEARRFYGQLLQCPEGRSAPDWVDFDFFGHQIVAHLSTGGGHTEATNEVDGDAVPIRHFGVIVDHARWVQLAETFMCAKVKFVVEPHVRFEGRPGEQWTLFVHDPSGNALEFKAFADDSMVFAKTLG